eukprot:Em0005g696a
MTPEPPKEKRIAKELSKAHSRMNACTTSTAITAEEKKEATKILTVDFMSSEETGQETAGSDNERVPPATIFKLRPLPWRSDRANSIIASMDRKAQRRSSDRPKEMCRKRSMAIRQLGNRLLVTGPAEPGFKFPLKEIGKQHRSFQPIWFRSGNGYITASRTRMTRLNHLMLLHVHKERTDVLDLEEAAREFIVNSEHRQRIFGAF